jgi:hypothetical protein
LLLFPCVDLLSKLSQRQNINIHTINFTYFACDKCYCYNNDNKNSVYFSLVFRVLNKGQIMANCSQVLKTTVK